MKNQSILIIGIVLAISIIPIVQAVTEPNIIIDMVTSQTTSPFVIKNSTGANVFEISPNGEIYRETELSGHFDILVDSLTCEVGEGKGDNLIRKWAITNPAWIDPFSAGLTLYDIIVDGYVQELTGTGISYFTLFYSIDGGSTWIDFGPAIDSVGTGYEYRWQAYVNSAITTGQTVSHFGIGCYNDELSTLSTKFEHIHLSGKYWLSNGMTITEVAP